MRCRGAVSACPALVALLGGNFFVSGRKISGTSNSTYSTGLRRVGFLGPSEKEFSRPSSACGRFIKKKRGCKERQVPVQTHGVVMKDKIWVLPEQGVLSVVFFDEIIVEIMALGGLGWVGLQ